MPKFEIKKDVLIMNAKGMSRTEIAKFARKQLGDGPTKTRDGYMLDDKFFFYQIKSIDPDIYVASKSELEPTQTRKLAKGFKK